MRAPDALRRTRRRGPSASSRLYGADTARAAAVLVVARQWGEVHRSRADLAREVEGCARPPARRHNCAITLLRRLLPAVGYTVSRERERVTFVAGLRVFAGKQIGTATPKEGIAGALGMVRARPPAHIPVSASRSGCTLATRRSSWRFFLL